MGAEDLNLGPRGGMPILLYCPKGLPSPLHISAEHLLCAQNSEEQLNTSLMGKWWHCSLFMCVCVCVCERDHAHVHTRTAWVEPKASRLPGRQSATKLTTSPAWCLDPYGVPLP